MSQLLWARSTYPTVSTFPVGGNRSTRRKPTTLGRGLTLLFSHEDWVRVHLTGDNGYWPNFVRKQRLYSIEVSVDAVINSNPGGHPKLSTAVNAEFLFGTVCMVRDTS